MAEIERNTTTDTAAEPVRPDYFSFVGEVTYQLHDAISLVEGAGALLCTHPGWEGSDELSRVLRLIRMLRDGLDDTLALVDRSSFAYALKERQRA
ncbi:hypothetical protein [Methyloversatilis sp. MC4-4]|uniref:hypothetical protein n=1 Tax=Methyloversatilis sp. MC4-4 TaxID=3132824 RepID=UPI003CEDCCFC